MTASPAPALTAQSPPAPLTALEMLSLAQLRREDPELAERLADAEGRRFDQSNKPQEQCK